MSKRLKMCAASSVRVVVILGWMVFLAPSRGEPGDGEIVLGDDSLRVRIVEGHVDNGIPRFDASARAVSVQRDGVEFLTEDGLVDEFNIRWVVPPGYADGVDGAFLKIGVGVLQRVGCAPYRFWNFYPILRPAKTTLLERGGDHAVFEQTLDDPRWSYIYRKAFHVDARLGRVAISYTFENRGTEEVFFDQYNHNWLLLDPPTVDLPWIVTTSLDASRLSLTAAWLAPGQASFQKPVPSPILFLRSQADPAPFATTRVTQGRKSITVTTLFPASRFGLFVTDRCLAPEVFAAFRVPPGGRVSWKRIYLFRESAPWPRALWKDALHPGSFWSPPPPGNVLESFEANQD